MTVRGRDTLYKYFQAGELPTEEHFHDLIESMLNWLRQDRISGHLLMIFSL